MEEQVQSMYYEFQMINQQVEELSDQKDVLNQELNQLNNTIEALSEIRKVESEEEILVPLSQGIFARATIKNTETLLVNVGAETLVKKDIDSTKEILNGRISRMKEFLGQTQNNIQSLQQRAQQISQELQGMLENVQ